MTDTLISLISIFIGITGANITGYLFKKYSFGIIGNSIGGVFGISFLIKSVGKLGIDPKAIMELGHANYYLFTANSIVSFVGGCIAVILISKIKNKMNSNIG